MFVGISDWRAEQSVFAAETFNERFATRMLIAGSLDNCNNLHEKRYDCTATIDVEWKWSTNLSTRCLESSGIEAIAGATRQRVTGDTMPTGHYYAGY